MVFELLPSHQIETRLPRRVFGSREDFERGDANPISRKHLDNNEQGSFVKANVAPRIMKIEPQKLLQYKEAAEGWETALSALKDVAERQDR